MEDKYLQKMAYLQDVVHKCINSDPELSLDDLAIILAWEIYDEKLPEFIKTYKKEFKKA
jgi:hypothetical protein